MGTTEGLGQVGQYSPFGVSFYLLKLWGRASSIRAQQYVLRMKV